MTQPNPDEHAAHIAAWRRDREDRLRQPRGWLSLVGLDWLTDGSNDIVLPDGTTVGRIVVTGDEIVAHGESGELTHDGRPADALALATDADGEPTLLGAGRWQMIVIRRGDRLALRTWDSDAPSSRAFVGVESFPVDLRWRINAQLEPAEAGRTIGVPNVLGEIDEEPWSGTVVFELNGAHHRLEALHGGDSGELWLIFGDATNGDTTYAGGRFLYTDPPAADATVVVDFNRAYNPPCVFSPYATCPLPPEQNRLSIRIEAGERIYRGA